MNETITKLKQAVLAGCEGRVVLCEYAGLEHHEGMVLGTHCEWISPKSSRIVATLGSLNQADHNIKPFLRKALEQAEKIYVYGFHCIDDGWYNEEDL